MSLNTTQIPSIDGRAELTDATLELVQQWVLRSSQLKTSSSSQRLAGLLQDPNGLDFAVGFVDGVIRPEDLRVAARNLHGLRKLTPKFLPWILRALIFLGALLAPIFPWIVIPIARVVLKKFVAHLVIDASLGKLGKGLRRLRKNGAKLNINLLGEAVLGEKEAKRRIQKISQILARRDVDYVSIKVSATVSPHSKWAFDETVTDVVQRLTPLYKIAATSATHKFINLDMEEYHDLDVTVAVFKKLLSQPQFKTLEAGIVLQAYLPDALRAMIDLQQWAMLRKHDGGAPIKVRVVKGANLPMEKVDAEIHGWPLATVRSKAEADSNYKRVLNYALTKERVQNVKIGVAGHNLFDIAFAWLLAGERGAQEGMDIEMLLGMAETQSKAVQETVGALVLYTPVVHPQEFDVAIAYLIRRLEEGASSDNFLSGVFELINPVVFDREKTRFLTSLEILGYEIPIPNRLQDRNLDLAVTPATGFENTPDTDSAISQNRAWGYRIINRLETSTIGQQLVEDHTLKSESELEILINKTHAAGIEWGKKDPYQRGQLLHEIGVTLERNRDKLIEVSMAEAGKTLDQADVEVSEAIDFAHYYAERAKDLAEIDGADPVPIPLTVVTPPWNFPIAIPAGSALAALAAGSAVIFKPAGLAARCGAVLAELMLEVLDKNVFVPIQISESGLGQKLLSHQKVGQVILTGGYETAQLFKSFNPGLKLLAETSGKNSLIITPSADLDLAAKDVAYSAFGHAGQKCSAASIVILVGSVATSKRFTRQLLDAVTSVYVSHPSDPRAQMGPLIAPPEAKLLKALTTLGPKENWLLEPKQLDETGKLWSPGIVQGVRPQSTSHLVEYFGPVLAVMTARNLQEALEIQNAVDYGLTAGIHSLDESEINRWLNSVQAGNLYVNRGITGAIVRRQPFGGWKKSAIGPGSKAGGPNYLMGLTNFASKPNSTVGQITNGHINHLLAQASLSGLSDDDLGVVIRGAKSGLQALSEVFGKSTDPSALKAERNVFRYFRSDCSLRIDETASELETWRALMSAAVLGNVSVSASALPTKLVKTLGKLGARVSIESSARWAAKLSGKTARIRFIGDQTNKELLDLRSSCDIAIYDGPQTESGRIELLPYFKEQAVSVTAHRFGSPTKLATQLSI
jgi:RHH-type proline utilization regulon transcriptional repressor/proline dehydrogenase/delta 1-pyrroline-5-carboxylate dehydrogenase